MYIYIYVCIERVTERERKRKTEIDGFITEWEILFSETETDIETDINRQTKAAIKTGIGPYTQRQRHIYITYTDTETETATGRQTKENECRDIAQQTVKYKHTQYAT